MPRLIAADADLSQIAFISGTENGSAKRPFDPGTDIEHLREEMGKIGNVRLLIVDPIVSAITGDSHKNTEVRRGLQPLVDLAAASNCALLGITHFSKGTGGRDPLERITGSLAFGAMARVVLVAAKHQEEGEDGGVTRVLCRAKSNIGPDAGGFKYSIIQSELSSHPGVFSSSLQWGEAIQGGARELLAEADSADYDGDGGLSSDSESFLASLLADGPVPFKSIEADTSGAGLSWKSIKKAQKKLGVVAEKTGMKTGWVWRLKNLGSLNQTAKTPLQHEDYEDSQPLKPDTFGTFGANTHLPPDTEEF